MSQINTVAVTPPVNNIDLSKPTNSNSSPTVLIPNPVSQPVNNTHSVNYPINTPQTNINHNPSNNSSNNNLIITLVTSLLVALAVSGAFLISQHMKETQEKLATVEKEKEEIEKEKQAMEEKLAKENNQQQKIESFTNEVKNNSVATNNPINPVSTHSINQQEALNIIQKWYDAKPRIFGGEFNQYLVQELTTGQLYNNTTKYDGSMNWLINNNCYYDYQYSNIDNVISFNNSGTRPSLTVRVSEKLALHGSSSAGCNGKYKSYTKPVTYWFEKENGNWKIYNYEVK
ncbi:ARC6/PARC6 family protein, partial [Geminocystis sp. CENA526]|uniref:ARC6/PARC6 family protein n=1 Tax=Geminocystis sp. CENA526 TaxID=1355871 RepID=UPI003D6FD4B7